MSSAAAVEDAEEAPGPRVRVVPDDDPESPRTWSNLGTMACWHRGHNLGDVQPREEPAEWLKDNAPPGSVVLPLYLLDHSGLRMKVGAFNDPWDSGQVGWIVCTPETIRKEHKVQRISKKTRAQVERVLAQEVDTYDDYLSGNVWGFSVDDDPECDASCWGFFGTETTLAAMQEHVPERLHAALAEAWENRFR
jgi:hypothetical protein